MRGRFLVARLVVFVCAVALGLAALFGDTSSSEQKNSGGGSSALEAGVATHETRTEFGTAPVVPGVIEMPTQGEIAIPPPTRGSFMANWNNVGGATGYHLDVSTDSSFGSYVNGYRDLDVGNVSGRVVTGLNLGTTYYYRVRSYNASGSGEYSDVMSVTTVATTGLIIQPTFDSSITNNPNAAAIEAMINRAISIYESMFSDPITLQVRYRYASTAPDGTPLQQRTVSQSDYVVYRLPWNTFISALRSDAKTNNDSLANASLPGAALSANITAASANGRALGLDTPAAMFANGTIGDAGPYDGIVTLNSAVPFQFTRPTSSGNFDAQRSTEHETDEVMGLRSHASVSNFCPQDLFSWSSTGVRNITSNGTRYFSINGGASNIVNFSQNTSGDLGDWLSDNCPQAHPYVQNAFSCTDQSSDISATSPEGINLDVIGYDLVNAPPGAPAAYDFNRDGHPDYLLFNPTTRSTVIWYMNNNVHVTGATGPMLPVGWSLVDIADFNGDGHPDYLLFNPTTRSTVIWYMNNNIHVTGAYGPTLPAGWEVVAAADFNRNGHPDYLLFNPTTGGTVIWYMNNNIHVSGAPGPTLPAGWEVVAAADFNRNGHPDYLLFNPTTGGTVIWYMNNNIHVSGASGPTLPVGWRIVGAADFDTNGKPDYVLYNPSTQQTVIWYLNNNVLIGGAFGPTLPTGWSLVAP